MTPGARPTLPTSLLSRLFVVAALALSISAAVAAASSFWNGSAGEGLLLSAVSIFAGWMATAVIQFHHRLVMMDQAVAETRSRIEESRATIAEMRRLARRFDEPSDEGARDPHDPTIH